MRTIKYAAAALILAQATSISAYASKQPSEWAKNDLSLLENYGIKSYKQFDKSYTEPINRGEICTLIMEAVNVYYDTNYTPKNSSPFDDTDSDDVVSAYEIGIINGVSSTCFMPDKSLTRQEASKIFSETYSLLTDEAVNHNSNYAQAFNDYETISPWAVGYVSYIAQKGLIKGDGDGKFNPEKEITVEQAAAILSRVLNTAGIDNGSSGGNANTDSGSNSGGSSAGSSSNGSSSGSGGSSDGSSNGNSDNNSENSPSGSSGSNSGSNSEINTDVSEPTPSDSDLDISVEIKDNSALISWKSDTKSTVTVYEQRKSYYKDDFEPNITAYTSDTSKITLELHPNKDYTIKIVTENGETDTVSFTTDKFTNDYEHMNTVKELTNTFDSDEIASANMETLTVNVWQLDGNEKYASTLTVTVCSEIADRVSAVFEEIFNGEEKFPIYSIGAYAWRAPMSSGRYSEHNFGTAIDINPNENYCLYSDGSVVGECYEPYKNPYSITPYGDVVNAFEKYGFTWGGDSWKSPKDYMHFSYLGT